MTDNSVVISVRNVSFSYPVRNGFMKWSKYESLRGVSFDLMRGETMGIVGRNGAGKSSLLRIIAGIALPDDGRVINFGAKVSLLALGVGFVPHLTGRQNAVLGGMLLGLSRREILDKIDSIIEFSDLGDFFDQPFNTYSSGMRSRLAFSTAIQVDPDVLLVDEVLGVGDESFRIKSTAEMKRMIRSEKTVVLVSHSMPVIKELCNRVTWIEDGVLRAGGETNVVLAEYLKGAVAAVTQAKANVA